MNRLIIDAGNTSLKAAVFNNGLITDRVSFRGKLLTPLVDLIGSLNQKPATCIISNVRKDDHDLEEILTSLGVNTIIKIRSGMVLPVKIQYKTPQTLGNDRLANVCAASVMFPGMNLLIVDIGTCIKYDLLRMDCSYPGGAISPGLRVRYKSLSTFTGKLPYFKPDEEEIPLIGASTEGSIRSGVENGIIEEINGMAERFSYNLPDLKLILTGGDYERFVNKLKKSIIFADKDLTIIGLHEILKLNEPH